MSSLFETLPGLEVPVERIGQTLADMWQGESSEGHRAPSEFRASQMNLVLHFGLRTTAERAREMFSTAIRFSQRYPCRIIALCPEEAAREDIAVRSKVFSECYIGSSRREMSCCEALVFGYAIRERGFLEDQVSVAVEADLPVYYWAHGFADRQRVSEFQYLLRIAQRVVFDSAVDEGFRTEVALPKSGSVRDLAYARLLPVRQSIGQFLSGFSAEAIGGGLAGVVVRHGEEWRAEASALGEWLRAGLVRSGAAEKSAAVRAERTEGDFSLEIEFVYSGGKLFRWRGDFAGGQGHFDADLGAGRSAAPATARLLPPDVALAEALFF